MANDKSDTEAERLLYVRCEDGGYKGWRTDLLVEKLEEVEKTYLMCRDCGGLLRDACLIENETDQEVRCFECIPDNVELGQAQLYQDSVNEKYVICPLKEKGCDWSGTITQVISHLSGCDLFPVPCPLGCVSGEEEGNTIVRLERRFLEGHLSSLCLMRAINCDYCETQTKACEMNEHLSKCSEYLVLCPNSCIGGKGVRRVKRKDIASHLGEDCPLQEVPCPYAEYGCDNKMERMLVGQHEDHSIHKHLRMAVVNIKEQHSKILVLQSENAEKINEISLLEKDLAEEITSIKLSNRRKITELKGVVNFLISSLSSSPTVGTLDWKITGVMAKVRNKQITYSEPFYVGYYMCQCEVIWDHENQGHFACFLQILKGNWDDFLRWPFRWKYNFLVLNEKTKIYNYVNSSGNDQDVQLYPSCFEKPTEFGNNGFGLLVFLFHKDILRDEYLKNDSISFKIIIE